MASSEWIESADTHGRAPQSSGPKTSFSSYGDHLLVMAAQDEAAKRAEEARAARIAAREGGPDILAALFELDPDPDRDRVGLDVLPTILNAIHHGLPHRARRIIGELDTAGITALRADLKALRGPR